MRKTVFVTTLVFVILITGGSALAWDCTTPSPKESFRRADVVFEGEVVRVDRSPEDVSTTYTFSVDKVFKGPHVKEVVIFVTSSSCAATFLRNEFYRVYASEYKGKLTSGACSGNVVLKRKSGYQ